MTRPVSVREATSADLSAVLGVLDAAALETNVDRVRRGIDRGDVLVAVADADADDPDSDRAVLGTLVLDGQEIANVAVRRRRRDQGIGTALVEAAAARRERLVAEFDQSVRPFYESLGFAVEPAGDERYRGQFDACEN
jgi:GNAT superfamily N-acetyltransferase